MHPNAGTIIVRLPIWVRFGTYLELGNLRVGLHVCDAPSAADMSVRVRFRSDLERFRMEL